MPDQINILRANMIQYFHDIQQFNEWLNTNSDRLGKRRPLDVLTEDGGLNRLTAVVSATRQRVSTTDGR